MSALSFALIAHSAPTQTSCHQKINACFDILTRLVASGPVNRLLLEGTESVLRLTKQSVTNEAFSRFAKQKIVKVGVELCIQSFFISVPDVADWSATISGESL